MVDVVSDRELLRSGRDRAYFLYLNILGVPKYRHFAT